MVILSQALIPAQSNRSIAERLGIALDDAGFVAAPEAATDPFATTRPGVFGCGFCQAPMDVPDSVIRASAAAARTAEMLARVS